MVFVPPKIDSRPPEETQDSRSKMAMNNPKTREQFEAREIEQSAPTTQEVTAANAAVIADQQSKLRAFTVSGRKAQRAAAARRRQQQATNSTPTPARVRDPAPVEESTTDEVIDRIYGLGKPRD